MKKLVIILHYIIYLVGLFFLIMSFSAFSLEGSIWYKIGGYFINSSPGIALILLNYFLRKEHLIKGIILILLAISSIIFFKLYIDVLDKIIVVLVVPFPLIISGIIFIIYHKKYICKQKG